MLSFKFRSRKVSRDSWAISLLEVEPNFNILELGPDRGQRLIKIAKITTTGRVFGLIKSALLIPRVERKTKKFIEGGVVSLKVGSVRNIPYPDSTFDIVFGVNVLSDWSNPEKNLKEIHRVLKYGGLYGVFEEANKNKFDRILAAKSLQVKTLLEGSGFNNIRIDYKKIKSINSYCLLATK